VVPSPFYSRREKKEKKAKRKRTRRGVSFSFRRRGERKGKGRDTAPLLSLLKRKEEKRRGSKKKGKRGGKPVIDFYLPTAGKRGRREGPRKKRKEEAAVCHLYFH